MNLYQQFETNSQCEVDGLFLHLGPNSKGDEIKFKLARAGGKNVAFGKSMEKHTKPVRQLISMNLLSPDKAEAIVRAVFIEAVLKGWDNVEDRDGKLIPYTPENADQLFRDLPDLFATLQEYSKEASVFRDNSTKADAKN